jgi:hypothetical protein
VDAGDLEGKISREKGMNKDKGGTALSCVEKTLCQSLCMLLGVELLINHQQYK